MLAAAVFPRESSFLFGFFLLHVCSIPFFMLDPDPNPDPEPPECSTVAVPLRQKVAVDAIPVSTTLHIT